MEADDEGGYQKPKISQCWQTTDPRFLTKPETQIIDGPQATCYKQVRFGRGIFVPLE